MLLPQPKWSWRACALVSQARQADSRERSWAGVACNTHRQPLRLSLVVKLLPAPKTARIMHHACVLPTCCADRDAQVLDFIQFNRRAALNSSLKHSACSYLPPKDAVLAADEAIHMYPFDLSPQCEVGVASCCR